MTLTTCKSNHKRPAKADSRPKGGNAQQNHHHYQYQKALESYIQSQWDNHIPQWFITIQWTPAHTTFEHASDHAKHFRNLLLTSIYSCTLKKLPPPEERCRLIWFHERAQDPKGRLIYHSHLHLSDCPRSISTALGLHWIIDTKVAPGFQCLKHLHRKRDPAIIIKPWNQKYHGTYNLNADYTT